MKTKLLFLERMPRVINMSIPERNQTLSLEVSRILSNRLGIDIPLNISIVDEKTVKLVYTVSLENCDDLFFLNHPDSFPEQFSWLVSGEWKDFKPEFRVDAAPRFGGYFQVLIGREEIERIIKANNRHYGCSRVSSVEAKADGSYFGLLIHFW